MTRWHLLTGEFPPDTGGVAHFTATIAGALAGRDLDVHVWAPATAAAGATSSPRTFSFHALSDRFGPRSRADLRAATAPGDVILLQYVPNALGARGANVAFCRWLLAQSARGCDVRVMFHEPFFYFGWQSPARNVLALVQRAMAAMLLRAASVAYVSTWSWAPLLRRYAPACVRFAWVPVPSAVPVIHDAGEVRRLRTALDASLVVGHFSSYPEDVRRPLRLALQDILARHGDVAVLCIGRGGEQMVASMGGADPRVHATGELDAARLSLAIQACDVFVQPYPDGATTRRTSLATLLAHGAAVVTTTGRHTEPLWTADGDVTASAPAGNRQSLSAEVSRVLASAAYRRALGESARQFYARHLAPRRAVDALLNKGAAPLPIVVGAHVYANVPEAAERQGSFARMLRATPRARLFDVQFRDGGQSWPLPGVQTLAVLRQDSVHVSGRPGARKPIVPEIFDALARSALASRLRYFLYANADVEIDASALEAIAEGGRDAYMFFRTDVGGGDAPELLRAGVDAFAFDARWWTANRSRFRPYILGEPAWDNVYASIALCHGNAALVCVPGLLRHERHATRWRGSPFAEYARMLAALDAPYFTLWCEFFERIKDAGTEALPATATRAAAEVFRWSPSRRVRAIHVARMTKARLRYALHDVREIASRA